jgi:cell filamentation protein
MNQKYAVVGTEVECEPGSNGLVLRNLLGITDPEDIEEAESAALQDALTALVEALPADHRFTAEDIRMLHRTWLGGIYPWAGEYRSVDLGKPGIDFAHAAYIQAAMAKFETEYLARYTPCLFAERAAQVEALAVTHGELVVIHPFREGNGRCARILAVLMATQAGLPILDFSAMAGAGQGAYFGAIVAAWSKRNYGPLASIFEEVIRTSLMP